MLYRGMDRAQLDAAYNNSAAIPGRDAIVADWAVRSARVRREYAGHLDLAYGATTRERLDLFLTAQPKAPTLAFIYGGYWQIKGRPSGSRRSDHSNTANGVGAAGETCGLNSGNLNILSEARIHAPELISDRVGVDPIEEVLCPSLVSREVRR
jgi:hypothetical protein